MLFTTASKLSCHSILSTLKKSFQDKGRILSSMPGESNGYQHGIDLVDFSAEIKTHSEVLSDRILIFHSAVARNPSHSDRLYLQILMVLDQIGSLLN